jgi:peptidoglycan/xylan/chitin deacetylase (PgdA/CDA1 family)
MFLDKDIKGFDLPPKTLCLTYDDGPGRDTVELGEYLCSEGIRAAFFVVGRHVEADPDAVRTMHACGHTIGNHTYSHPGLVALAETAGNVVGELRRTDDLLRRHAPSDVVFFRAPYGNWRQKVPGTNQDANVSIVAGILNGSESLRRYVGPVNWDISAADYDCWARGASGEDCGRAYLEKVERIGHGIVLMHDSSEDPTVRPRNRALKATEWLVPRLKERGYRFVSLDDLPQVRNLSISAAATLHVF